MHGTSAGDGLNGAGSLLGEGRGRRAQNELSSLACEGGKSGDGKIFVVQVGIVTKDLVGLGSTSRSAVWLFWYHNSPKHPRGVDELIGWRGSLRHDASTSVPIHDSKKEPKPECWGKA